MSAKSFLFILFISFALPLKATPTVREKYSDDYLKLVELIFDNHNVDIMNRDFYEGYTMNFLDTCSLLQEKLVFGNLSRLHYLLYLKQSLSFGIKNLGDILHLFVYLQLGLRI